jgi:arylsulfatase A
MRRPNVVLINCDDLGWGDLGCYGSTRNKTPALDRLAAEGMRFDAFYSASPVCSPSRGALMTGCYPARIGFGSFRGLPVLFPGQRVGLNPSEITIARLLREAGYRTQMVGKWHCGDQPEFLPTAHGFDHYFGIPYSNDMGRQVNTPAIFPPGGPPPLPLLLDDQVIEQQPDQASLTERYLQEAVRFMREARDEPFFLYFAHMYVHVPIYVQERFAQQSTNGRYGAAVESIDWSTAVLMHELRRLGLADDTIVIFTSDNGSHGDNPIPWGTPGPLGASNGPFRGIKGTTWEGGQRVPGIVRWPRRIPAGQVSGEVVTAMDLYPTLARLCGATVPTDRTIDGRDISALLTGDAQESPHEAFFYWWMNSIDAVRSGRWKLHVGKQKDAILELYDLDADPGETTNMAAAHPDVVARLRAMIEAEQAELGDERAAIVGRATRPIGMIANPAPLTQFDPEHPYYMAEYDLADRG